MSRAVLSRRDATQFAQTVEILSSAEGRVYTGAALNIRIGGNIACDAAFGSLSPGGPPVAVDSLFDLASVTKIFVGTALLALFDRRVFALDDRLVSVLPEFAGLDARRSLVTFRHLLSHTSGLPAHVNFRDEVGSRAIVGRVCATPLANAPGSVVAYSDLGFILVGVAVERLSGRPLAEAVREFVISPLGLPDAAYTPSPALSERIACTERDSWRGKLLQGEVHDENCWSMGGVSGHAGLFASAAEVGELGECYRLAGTTDRARVLSRHAAFAAINEQARNADERRGLAWALKTSSRQSCGSHFGSESFGHTGYTGTSLWVDPTRALTVALLTNRVYFTREPGPIFELRAAVHDAVIEDLGRAEKR